MRKLLLNTTPLFRKLRQLSMLLTLLLVPLGALGQTITVADIYPDQSGLIAGENITGTVSFNSQTNTLTLNGASITGLIHWMADANLTIELIGANSITRDGFCIDYEGNGAAAPQISFTAGGENCSLILNGNGLITGFSNADAPTMGPGLYWIPTWNNGSITSATITNSILGGGAGTEGSPFIISTFEHLKTFAKYVNDGILSTEYIKLGESFDCTGKTGFEPIGNTPKSFIGTFDGGGNSISGLSFSNTNPDGVSGLFGNIGSFNSTTSEITSGTVKNLTLNSCQFGNGARNGAIAGNLAYGTIENCAVTSCIISSGNSQSTNSGGITGIIEGNGIVKDCSVNGGTITSSTTKAVDGEVYAGGIVASASGSSEINGCTVSDVSINSTCNQEHNSYSGGIVGYSAATISGNSVKGTTTINSINKENNETFAGAIVAKETGGSLTNNYYYYTVNTKTKIGDNEPVEKSGYTQRGIGSAPGSSSSDEIGKVELAGTKKITITPSSIGGESHAKAGTYYLSVDNQSNNTYDVYALPGNDVGIEATPTNEYYKPRLILSDENINVTSVEIDNKGAYDHTEFTFTMPDANLTATLSFPVDLSANGITASIDPAGHTGEAVIPTTVKAVGIPGSTGITNLTNGTDFTITGYQQNGASVTSAVNIGTYTVTIEGKGDYIGTKNMDFEIVESYALTINGTLVHVKNAADILGDKKISFTPATNTLTLNSATINGAIESGLSNLTVHLTGSSTITGTDASNQLATGIMPTSTNTTGTLTFTSDVDADSKPTGRLTFTYVTNPLGNFAEKTYQNGLDYDATNKEIGLINYNLIVGESVTSVNKTDVLGDGKVSYDPEKRILTLNDGTNITSGGINVTSSSDLTVVVDGTINVTGSTYAINTNGGKINFVKGEGATSVNLTATCGNGYTPINFNSISLGSGLYWKPIESVTTVITDDPEFIIIDDYAMTDTRTTINGTSGTITYNPTDKVLTLNAFTNNFGDKHAIITGVSGLKVKLTGESAINCGNNFAVFHAFSSSASIQFVKVDATSKLNMVGTAIDNFADGSVTYDGLVLYSDNYIAIPEPPTMALNSNDKVELTITYSGGTIATKYSIDYADETADVTNATYSDPFEIAAPGTVTAWVEANGATTSTVKGKHFGYESKTFTMKSGETKAVVLAPAIEASDNIALADNPYASDAEGVATLSNAVINAISIGKANLSTTLANTNAQEHTVILNKDNKFTIEVNVGAIMEGITFAPNMLYATYCNTTSKNMTVPEGMTAYAVTGTEGNNVTTEVVEFLPMNVPLLLMRSNASTEVGLSLVYDRTATAPATNILNFTNSDLATTGKEYVLYNDEFVKATSTIRQNHCYLLITNPAPTRGYYSIGNGNDGSTAIDDTLIDNEETTNDDWYDLQGRRIQKPTKAGIYIVNGKKMIVK